MNFATSEDLEEFTEFTFTAKDHVRAEKLLRAASGEIRGWCDQMISRGRTEDLIIRPEWVKRRLLALRERPVFVGEDDPFEILIDGEPFTDLDIDRDTGLVWRSDGLAWPHPADAEITVTYSHGHDPVPDDVWLVCLERAAAMWVNPEGNMQRRRGDASTAFASSAAEATGLNESQKSRLERYRR